MRRPTNGRLFREELELNLSCLALPVSGSTGSRSQTIYPHWFCAQERNWTWEEPSCVSHVPASGSARTEVVNANSQVAAATIDRDLDSMVRNAHDMDDVHM
jgi:hypothetical protein